MGLPLFSFLWKSLDNTSLEIKHSASWSWILIKVSKQIIQSNIFILLLLFHYLRKSKKHLPVIFTSTPAEASKTATAPSRTLKQRSTSTVKSTWPKKQSPLYTIVIQTGNINSSLQIFFFLSHIRTTLQPFPSLAEKYIHQFLNHTRLLHFNPRTLSNLAWKGVSSFYTS